MVTLAGSRVSADVRIVSSMRVQSIIDRCQQRGSIKGLAEEAADAPCERTLLVTHHVAAGYEEYGKIRPHTLHEIIKRKPVNGGHADVGYQAIDVKQSGVDQRLRRRVRANQIAARFEKFSQ